MTEWAEHQSFNNDANTNVGSIQLLSEIVERLQTDMDAFYEIVQVDTKPQSGSGGLSQNAAVAQSRK